MHGSAAVAGIGESTYYKRGESPHTEFQLACMAIQRAVEANDGSTDGEALAKTIEGFKDEPLLVGPVTYTPECHIPVGMPMQVRTVEGGESKHFASVDPETVPASPC